MYIYKIISSYCRTKNLSPYLPPDSGVLRALYYNFHLYKHVLDLDKPKKTPKMWVERKAIEDFLLVFPKCLKIYEKSLKRDKN